MPHLNDTQRSQLMSDPTYFWVKFKDGSELATVNWTKYSKTVVGAGLFLDSDRKQTYGTADIKFRSLKHLLRWSGRKVSDVKAHNWTVID